MSSFETQFDSKGFVPGVYRGTRSFLVDEDGNLTGVFYRQTWNPGINDAACMKGTVPSFMSYYYKPTFVPIKDPEPPEPHSMDGCRHGFYGYYSGSNDYYAPGKVSAVIEGWGNEVMVGSRGFRCMKARIVALCVSDVVIKQRERIELVTAKYSMIPFFDTFQEMVDAFPPDEGEDD